MINRELLRAKVRNLGDEYIFYMLDDAIEMLSDTKLLTLVKPYLDPAALQLDSLSGNSLFGDVEKFYSASRAGDYYDSFDVNSKNYTRKSMGTLAWISDCNRLLDRCVREGAGCSEETRRAFDFIFELLDLIDECNEDIIFFADEAGSWQVGVDWEAVLPAWFKVLAETAGPEEYSQRVTGLTKNHFQYGYDEMLKLAQKVATPAQRQALTTLQANLHRGAAL